jgi:hypothetical protein
MTIERPASARHRCAHHRGRLMTGGAINIITNPSAGDYHPASGDNRTDPCVTFAQPAGATTRAADSSSE